MNLNAEEQEMLERNRRAITNVRLGIVELPSVVYQSLDDVPKLLQTVSDLRGELATARNVCHAVSEKASALFDELEALKGETKEE